MKNPGSVNSIVYFILLLCITVILGVISGYIKTTFNMRFLGLIIPALILKSYGSFLVKQNILAQKYWIVPLLLALGGMFFIDTQFISSFEWYAGIVCSTLYIWFLTTYFYALWKKNPKRELT